MAAPNKVTLNLQDLTALNATLKTAGNLHVRVGILGEHVVRPLDAKGHTRPRAKRIDRNWNVEPITNPELGAIHEFGDPKNHIPARSFLMMPLLTKLPGQIEKIGKAVWRALILKQGLRLALKQLGVLGENQVQEAFNTGGFGQWKPLAASTIKRKGSAAILIDSAQMAKSVTSAVTDSASNKGT